jgi:hypothetical protein
MRKILALVLVPLIFLVSGGFRQQKLLLQQPIAQPADERAAQMALPKSQSPVWGKFLQSKVSYNSRTGIYSIAVTPEVKALAGKTITVNGFVLPLDGSDHTSHFLLTRNTPVCMFCPPGEPNEVVEVVSPHPIEWTAKIVNVTGPLSLINNGEKGMFFKVVANEVH